MIHMHAHSKKMDCPVYSSVVILMLLCKVIPLDDVCTYCILYNRVSWKIVLSIRAEPFGEKKLQFFFLPIFRVRFRMLFFFTSSLFSVWFTKQAINHSIVWPTPHWKQSTYKLLFPSGQASVEIKTSLFNYWIVKWKRNMTLTDLQSVTVTNTPLQIYIYIIVLF